MLLPCELVVVLLNMTLSLWYNIAIIINGKVLKIHITIN
jgi:hypothetical protein